MQVCHGRKACSRFRRRSSFCCGVLWFAFCMTEYGPHSGESHSRLGLNSRSRSIANVQPDGVDKSVSSLVHLSPFRPAPSAIFVSIEVGEQNASTKSSCFSLLFSSVAISSFRFFCHFAFSLDINFAFDGGSGSVGSGTAFPPIN